MVKDGISIQCQYCTRAFNFNVNVNFLILLFLVLVFNRLAWSFPFDIPNGSIK